jgi:flagellar biosynthesis chaperone FliJ
VKTKFKPLVTVRKQAVKKVENELIAINGKIKNIKLDIINIETEINNSPIPQSGNFALMIAMKEMINIHRLEIDRKKSFLVIVEQQKDTITQKLKHANIEYEKMKHLHDVEVEKYLKEMKRKEEEEMNEIALMLFNNK